jgi:hypothetical protein
MPVAVLALNQREILHRNTDRASQGINSPSINLLRISSHRLIVDDLLKKPRHGDSVALRQTKRRLTVKSRPANVQEWAKGNDLNPVPAITSSITVGY